MLGCFDTPDSQCIAVHGYPRLQVNTSQDKQDKGAVFGHAWLERRVSFLDQDETYLDHVGLERIGPLGVCNYVAIDPSRMVILDRALYYFLGFIKSDECRRYTFEQLRELIVRHGHCGPFEDVVPEAVFKND